MISRNSSMLRTRAPAGGHRARPQPHVRSASVVSARPARRTGSPERDYYVWSDTDQRYAGLASSSSTPSARTGRGIRSRRPTTGIGFSIISRISTTTTRRLSARCWPVLDFWLDLGVDGFRLDAVPYLVERDDTTCENLPETHAIIRAIRAHVDAEAPAGCCWPRPTSCRPTCAPTSVTATNVTWPITSRSCRVSSWPCTWRIDGRSPT